MRTPHEIAAEAAELLASASRAFVPASIVKTQELAVEFMVSTVAALDELAGKVNAAPFVATLPGPDPVLPVVNATALGGEGADETTLIPGA